MNMPIEFCSEAYFSGLRLFNKPEISDSGPQPKVPPGGLVLKIFEVLKKSIGLSRVGTREP